MTVINRFILFIVFNAGQLTCFATPPAIQQAKTYHNDIVLAEYLVSEKLDGVRGYWDGNTLRSRNGLIISAPLWFVENFPNIHLDGELWIARGKFEQTLSVVNKLSANHDEWQQVKFMIFDLPQYSAEFSQRVAKMRTIVRRSNSPYLKLIEQHHLKSDKQLQAMLTKVIKSGGEGLMLHKANAYYQVGRNNNILKLKPYFDDEAVVIAHLPGKGKYRGMLGAILVETVQGIRFKIGTGFSDQQRLKPPPIGSFITFKYWGLSKNKVPRFASYLRQRNIP